MDCFNEPLDWKAVNSALRGTRQCAPDSISEYNPSKLTACFPAVVDSVNVYVASLHAVSSDDEGPDSSCVSACKLYESTTVSSAPNKTKKLNADARQALQFSLLLLSSRPRLSNEDALVDDIRNKTQEAAVLSSKLHICLSRLISHRSAESKCRVLAARLLSNLVTANARTASVVLKDIVTSPSKSELAATMLQKLTLTGIPNFDTVARKKNDASSWLEMVITTASVGDRHALAAVVAALHNCLMALLFKGNNDAWKENSELLQQRCEDFARSMAQDTMFMSNIVRNIFSVEMIIKPVNNSENNHTTLSQKEDSQDDATEWISLFLEKLVEFGLFSEMYKSLGSSSSANPPYSMDNSSKILSVVTHEQVVLLHCISRSVEEQIHAGSSTMALPVTSHGGLATQRFLAGLISEYSNTVCGIICSNKTETEWSADDDQLRQSAFVTVLEILATLLSAEEKSPLNHSVACCRVVLGQETLVLLSSCRVLWQMVDKLTLLNHDRKACELKISAEDQRTIIAIVRLVGNLCYRCRHNQDLLRTMEIFTTEKADQMKYTTDEALPSAAVRSGLHGLLTCTSFSFGCFPLREWAIVAIRNALEYNTDNQRVVHELEAKKVVDIPELQNLGLTVDLDLKGKVVLTKNTPPLD